MNIKNIDIEVIKRIKNRILNNDCNCQKPNDQNNDKGVVNEILCETLLMIVLAICSPLLLFELYGDIDNELLVKLAQLLGAFLIPIATPFVMLAMFLNCDWTYWGPY